MLQCYATSVPIFRKPGIVLYCTSYFVASPTFRSCSAAAFSQTKGKIGPPECVNSTFLRYISAKH